MSDKIKEQRETALIVSSHKIKQLFTNKFDGCKCHKAFPDQIKTFVGSCNKSKAMVACVPEGDVIINSPYYNEMYVIVAVCENISADYLEYLEDKNISYIFAGEDKLNINTIIKHLEHDFGIIDVLM